MRKQSHAKLNTTPLLDISFGKGPIISLPLPSQARSQLAAEYALQNPTCSQTCLKDHMPANTLNPHFPIGCRVKSIAILLPLKPHVSGLKTGASMTFVQHPQPTPMGPRKPPTPAHVNTPIPYQRYRRL